MNVKGDAHEALSVMFHCEGIPLSMLIDRSKQQMLDKFCQKLVVARFQQKHGQVMST